MWLSVSSFVLQLACVFPLLVRAESQSSDFICDTSGTAPVYNASSKYLGCYLDRTVSILQAAKLSTIAMTPQFCTNFCGKLGYKYAGVEFTT